MSLAQSWICPTCKLDLATPYCPACGEALLHPRDLTLRGLFDQIVESMTNIDARLLRSFRYLLTRPGELTRAYLLGQRKPFILPFPLFLVANLLFFGTQSLTGVNVFSTPLASHLNNQMWSPLAQDLVARHLAAIGMSMDAYEPLFNQTVLVNAKSLIILMALVFALFTPLVFIRSRIVFVVHVVFSLHLYAFLLVLFCAAMMVAYADVYLGGSGLESPDFDRVVSIVLLATCAAYLYVATGAVYGERGVMRIAKAAVLAIAVAALVLVYRFALFLITLYGG